MACINQFWISQGQFFLIINDTVLGWNKCLTEISNIITCTFDNYAWKETKFTCYFSERNSVRSALNSMVLFCCTPQAMYYKKRLAAASWRAVNPIGYLLGSVHWHLPSEYWCCSFQFYIYIYWIILTTGYGVNTIVHQVKSLIDTTSL